MPAILKHTVFDIFRAATEHSCRFTAGRYEGCCFVEVLVHILLQCDTCVKDLLLLTDLAIGEIRYDLTDKLDDLQNPTSL